MPAARRRGGNTAATRSGQSTLSFGSKSRITKPSAAPTTRSQKAKDLEPLVTSLSEKEPVQSASEPEELKDTPTESSQPHVAELAVRQQAQTEIKKPVLEEDQKASKLTERDLTRYWKQEEAKRRGPRVHQNDLTTHEKILRHFDLSSQYGPCIGIARLRRWRRANTLKLNPPIEVLAVLLKESEDAKQRAYIDELLS